MREPSLDGLIRQGRIATAVFSMLGLCNAALLLFGLPMVFSRNPEIYGLAASREVASDVRIQMQGLLSGAPILTLLAAASTALVVTRAEKTEWVKTLDEMRQSGNYFYITFVAWIAWFISLVEVAAPDGSALLGLCLIVFAIWTQGRAERHLVGPWTADNLRRAEEELLKVEAEIRETEAYAQPGVTLDWRYFASLLLVLYVMSGLSIGALLVTCGLTYGEVPWMFFPTFVAGHTLVLLLLCGPIYYYAMDKRGVTAEKVRAVCRAAGVLGAAVVPAPWLLLLPGFSMLALGYWFFAWLCVAVPIWLWAGSRKLLARRHVARVRAKVALEHRISRLRLMVSLASAA